MSLQKFTKKIIREEESIRIEKLNQEMIAYQNNEGAFLNSVEEAIQEIYDHYDQNIMDTKGVIPYIQNLEQILHKRFGIKIYIEPINIANAFCLVGDPRYRVAGDFKSSIPDLSKIIQDYEKAMNNPNFSHRLNSDLDMEKYRESNYDSYYNGDYDISYYNYIKKVYDTGFQMDFKNAKILNADKNQYIYIGVGFRNFFSLELKPRETMAIMFHELGHGWTDLERGYAMFANLLSLNDIIMEEYSRKNKTPVETIKIYYKKQGLPEPKVTKGSMVELALAAQVDVARNTLSGLSTKHSSSSHEQLADEFSSRFGLSKDLASALKKMGLNSEYDERGFELSSVLGVASIPLALIGQFTGFSTMITVGFPLALLVGSIYSLYKVTTLYSGSTYYDNYNRRLTRLKNTAIRNLSHVDNPVVKKDLIKQIEELDRMIKNDNKLNKMTSIKKAIEWATNKINPLARQEFLLSNMIEDLTANDLHVVSHLWNTKGNNNV